MTWDYFVNVILQAFLIGALMAFLEFFVIKAVRRFRKKAGDQNELDVRE